MLSMWGRVTHNALADPLSRSTAPQIAFAYEWALGPAVDALCVSLRRAPQRLETCEAHAFCPTVGLGHSESREDLTVSCGVLR
jgi:hypothetical protein